MLEEREEEREREVKALKEMIEQEIEERLRVFWHIVEKVETEAEGLVAEKVAGDQK